MFLQSRSTFVTTFLSIPIILLLTIKDCMANTNFVEFSTSVNTSTFDLIQTIGLFTRSEITKGEIIYAGLQLSQIKLKNNAGSSSFYRVLVGATIPGTYTPYVEIGTDLLSLFTTRNETNCGNANQCRINAFIKAGVRIQFQQNFNIGLFHESMSFDDTNNILQGNHSYTGLSFAYGFWSE